MTTRSSISVKPGEILFFFITYLLAAFSIIDQITLPETLRYCKEKNYYITKYVICHSESYLPRGEFYSNIVIAGLFVRHY